MSAPVERAEYSRAEDFFVRAWGLLKSDDVTRWRCHIALLRARGELALARGRHDEAWRFATESLELATETVARKHAARAILLRGEIMAARGRLEESVGAFERSARLAEELRTPRDISIARAALGRTCAKLGRDSEAEAHLIKAAQAIEAIASKLKMPSLSRSFLGAEPVRAVYAALGRPAPEPIS